MRKSSTFDPDATVPPSPTPTPTYTYTYTHGQSQTIEMPSVCPLLCDRQADKEIKDQTHEWQTGRQRNGGHFADTFVKNFRITTVKLFGGLVTLVVALHFLGY